MEAVDVDGDGVQELIVTDAELLRCFDIAGQRQLWQLWFPNDIGALAVGQLDQDVAPELVVGDFGSTTARPAYVRCLDLVSLVEEWRIPNEDAGTSMIALVDSDGDASEEILWNSGGANSGADHLHVTDATTLALEYQSTHLDGPLIGPAKGDVDGDGLPELVFASFASESGYRSGRVVVLDGTTMRLRALSPIEGFDSFEVWALVLKDVDGDGAQEIAVAGGYSQSFVDIYDFEGLSNTLQRRSHFVSQAYNGVFAMDIADVDRDGDLEILLGKGAPMAVVVLDLVTGAEEWRTPWLSHLSSNILSVAAMTAGDENPEIIALTADGAIRIFDGVSREGTQKLHGGFSSVWVDPGEPRSFVVGTIGGKVARFVRSRAGGYRQAASFRAVDGPIDGVAVLDDGWLGVTANGRLSIFDPTWTTRVMRSEPFGPGLRQRSILTHNQLWLTAGRHAVVGYPVEPRRSRR